jgi:hypothetical protein
MSTFGESRANRFTPAARRAAREARQARAVAIVIELRGAGITSLNGIAEALNSRGDLTPAGSDHWYAIQVSRRLRRLMRLAAAHTNRAASASVSIPDTP